MVATPTSRHPDRGDEDLVRLYLNEIGSRALLTKAREAELARLIEAGNAARAELEDAANKRRRLSPSRRRSLLDAVRAGDDATQTFVEANLRLVVSIARKYQASELPLSTWYKKGTWG